MIEDYHFGRIVIDGESYTSDVIIYPDRVDADWWRKVGHRLTPEDVEGIVQSEARSLIIGTGAYGLMRVPQETMDWLNEQGFEVIVEKTGEAWQTYNRLSEGSEVIGALHLSC